MVFALFFCSVVFEICGHHCPILAQNWVSKNKDPKKSLFGLACFEKKQIQLKQYFPSFHRCNNIKFSEIPNIMD